MKPNSSRTYSTRPSNCAKLCIASVCTALLFSPLCSGVGRAQVSTDQQIIELLQDIENGQATEYTLNRIVNALNSTTGVNQKLDEANDELNAIYALLGKISRKAGKDELAGNPWWATNSQFTSWNASFNDVFPQDPPPTSNYQQSFPEAFSGLLAQLYPYTANRMVTRTGWVDQWGWSRQLNTQLARGRSYTWFDWMSDATRSNWVLHASLAGTTDAPATDITAVTSAVDDGSTDGTNGVPDMVVDQMDVTGVEASLDLVDADAVGDMLPASYTGGNPEFVVFSGGRYGDVNVPEVRGSLALPENVARYLHGVATWLWRVALFVGCFIILRQEVAFWSTLGGSTSDA